MEIKNSDVWKRLISNPRFKECIKSYNNYRSVDNLVYEVIDDKLIVSYTSKVKNRDLDCQYRTCERTEYFIDEEDNLVVNELNSILESRYGYNFNNTNGGIIKTNYVCQVYSNDGIEISYQSYSDKYHLNSDAFELAKNDLDSIALGDYNPNLKIFTNIDRPIPHAKEMGKYPYYIRKSRSKDNLGVIDVVRCVFNQDKTINNLKEEYYFNTFFNSSSKHEPELIYIMNGFPFATIQDDKLIIDKDYSSLGLTDTNYKDVARDRLLKELNEEKVEFKSNPEISLKYDLMIEKLNSEESKKKRIH